MNDSISRQATYLAMVEKGQASKRYKLGETWELNGEEIREVLDALPSTQPDIIYCKDCKHHWTYKCMDGMPIEECDLEQTFYDANIDYCSLAERREVTE